jgi:hypothetical protein
MCGSNQQRSVRRHGRTVSALVILGAGTLALVGLAAAIVPRSNADDRSAVAAQVERRQTTSSGPILDVRLPLEGRIVAAGMVRAEVSDAAGRRPSLRPLRAGDLVSQGQTLAVIWSPELGELNSRLAAAASRLSSDERAIINLVHGPLPEGELMLALRRWWVDRASLSRAEQALAEVPQSLGEKATLSSVVLRSGDQQTQAPDQFELRAPRDGLLVEVASPAGCVAAQTVLFRIAELSVESIAELSADATVETGTGPEKTLAAHR